MATNSFLHGAITALSLSFSLSMAASTLAPNGVNLCGQRLSTNGTDYETYGIWAFTSTSDLNLREAKTLLTEPNIGAVKADNRFLSFSQEDYDFYYMYVYDVEHDWDMITKASVPAAMVEGIKSMAYDPVTKNIYVVYSNTSGSMYNCKLGILNLSNRTRQDIGECPEFLALAANSKGQLYGITAYGGTLYEIDKATADITYKGMTNVSPEYAQSAAFGPDDDVLYWAACTSDEGALYTVSIGNAKATKINDFPNEEQFVGLYVESVIVSPDAPGESSQIACNFPNGSTTGTVSFIAPSLTYCGNTLTGSLSYAVLVDGEEKATGTTTPASQTTSPAFSTTQGTHIISVVVSNGSGKGAEAKISAYIGKDTPEHVSNVVLARGNSDNDIVLTWDAPTEGVHGGFLDLDAVKYRVRRMPDYVTVTENGVSPFRESIEADKPARYFYEVIPYIDDSTTGIGMSSNKLMVGPAYTVPYFEDFTENDNVLAYTVEDSNDDGHSWEYQYDFGYFRIYDNDRPKDDWLFTPYIAFEAGKTYRLEFKVQTLATETYEVALATDASSGAVVKSIVDEKSIDEYNWTTDGGEFTVDETGNYFIGFHAMSEEPANALALYLDEVSVKVGDPAGIAANGNGKTVITAAVGQIIVATDSVGAVVEVFAIDGRQCRKETISDIAYISIPAGAYIVRTSTGESKVVVVK